MSDVHAVIGNTGWLRALKCDYCQVEMRRKVTEEVGVAVPFPPTHDLPYEDLHYHEEVWDPPNAPDGWVTVSTRMFALDGSPMPSYALCPQCAGVLLDQLMSHCTQPTTRDEQVEVLPAEVALNIKLAG